MRRDLLLCVHVGRILSEYLIQGTLPKQQFDVPEQPKYVIEYLIE